MKKTHTLKQCNGVHCRCMNLSGDCPHYHYVDCESRKDTPPSHTENEWREQFAAMEHTRWSKWQSYLHSKCTKNEDGSLTIPAGFVVHWERQIATPYSQLTEAEKESDRREVRPYTEHMQSLLTQARTDWLRSEIEKLEGETKELVTLNCYGNCNPRCHDSGKDIALSSIITRHKEELKELESQ